MRKEIETFVLKLLQLIRAGQAVIAANAIRLYFERYRPQLNSEEKLQLGICKALAENPAVAA